MEISFLWNYAMQGPLGLALLLALVFLCVVAVISASGPFIIVCASAASLLSSEVESRLGVLLGTDHMESF